MRSTPQTENWFVGRLRQFEGLLSPRVPVHRVVGVLQEIGAGLLRKAVFLTSRSHLLDPAQIRLRTITHELGFTRNRVNLLHADISRV